MDSHALLDPKLDVVFKLLFADARNKHLLCSLLTAVLEPSEPITDVEVLNPEVTRHSVQAKGAVLDVRALLPDRTRINVEMQLYGHRGIPQRQLYYWAKLYTEPLSRGDVYASLAPAVGDFAIHVLQLPRLRAVTRDPQDTGPGSAMVRWGRFLTARTDHELEQLAMQDPDLREAKAALERLSADPQAQRLAREREQWAWNHAQALDWAQREGRAEGEARGRAEGEARGLLRILEARGLALTTEQADRVLNCQDPHLLATWYQRALTVTSAAELLA
jgi:hypothetical protein